MDHNYELALYELNEDNPELLEVIDVTTYSACLERAKRLTSHLASKQFFEIFNDETLETYYMIKNGTVLTDFKQLLAALE